MLKLNLGCGFRKMDGFVNIDNRSECFPDLEYDLSAGLPYEDNSVDEIVAVDFLEHLYPQRVIFFITEIWRALKPDGFFFSMTPSTDGRGAFQDPTHYSFWNKNSWLYYMDDQHRELYGIRAKFKGNVWDTMTNEALKITHTRAELYAVK